jgi:hypothetical protein
VPPAKRAASKDLAMSRIVELARLYYMNKDQERAHRRGERREMMEELKATFEPLLPLLTILMSRRGREKDTVAEEHGSILSFFSTVQEHELKMLADIFGPRLLPVVEIMAKYASPSKEETASKQETLQ